MAIPFLRLQFMIRQIIWEIEIFQQGGVTLVYSGDQLTSRKRHSIAIEPMQYITNAFNRKELKEKVLIKPGEKSIFNFGVKAGKRS
jgi:galactose mutarotase-like enzyme